MATDEIQDTAADIAKFVRSTPDTERRCNIAQKDLREARKFVEKHITNTYLRQLQAPVGVKVQVQLQAWMELN